MITTENQPGSAAWVKDARQSLGLSKTQMSNALGVHFVVYSRWEKDDDYVPTASGIQSIKMLLFMNSENLLEKWMSFQ